MQYRGLASLCPLPQVIYLRDAVSSKIYLVVETGATARVIGATFKDRPMTIVHDRVLFLDKLDDFSLAQLTASDVKVREFVRGESVTIRAEESTIPGII